MIVFCFIPWFLTNINIVIHSQVNGRMHIVYLRAIASWASSTTGPARRRTSRRTPPSEISRRRRARRRAPWVALLVSRYLSNAASFALCVFRRVKDHRILLDDSPLLKKTCVGQVMLDKSPPEAPPTPRRFSWGARRGPAAARAAG